MRGIIAAVTDCSVSSSLSMRPLLSIPTAPCLLPIPSPPWSSATASPTVLPDLTSPAMSSGYLNPDPCPRVILPPLSTTAQCCTSYRPSGRSNTPASIPTAISWRPRAFLARFSAPLAVSSPNGCSGTPPWTSTAVILTSP